MERIIIVSVLTIAGMILFIGGALSAAFGFAVGCDWDNRVAKRLGWAATIIATIGFVMLLFAYGYC